MHSRLGFVAGGTLLAGGVAWFAKLSVIAATGGRVTDTGAASAFFFLGLLLLLAGAALAGVALTAGRHPAVRIAAGVLAPLTFMAIGLSVLESAGRSLLATEGTWWYDEVGIFLSAVLGAAAGAAILLRGRRRKAAAPA
jgi:hypothetical protein